MRPIRAMLIVNPHATSTTQRRRDLLAHALSAEVRLTVEHTGGRGHAIELAAKAVESGCKLVVVHGGDGTVNEVVNGIMSRGRGLQAPMLAVVPGGSTNVFARALGIEADPTGATEQILQALTEKQPPCSISLGLADDRYFTFNAGIGLDAEVVKAVEEVRATGRKISNSLHVRKTIRAWRESDRKHPRLTVQLPDAEPVSGAHLVFASNVDHWTYWESRPVRTNPQTTSNGGLGVFALTSLRLPTVLRLARQLISTGVKGPHSAKLLRADNVPWVEVTCERPTGLQVDGDYLGVRETVTFSSVPDALRVLGPTR